MIKVQLEGGMIVEVSQVRVFVEGLGDEGTDEPGTKQLQFNFTHEGLIQDLVGGDGDVIATSSVEYNEIFG